MNLHRTILIPLVALVVLIAPAHAADRKTTVSISGDAFRINGQPTYPGVEWKGHKIEGLLLNARMNWAWLSSSATSTSDRTNVSKTKPPSCAPPTTPPNGFLTTATATS